MLISPQAANIFVTASFDGTARRWLTDLDEIIRAVCAVLTRDLTPEERV